MNFIGLAALLNSHVNYANKSFYDIAPRVFFDRTEHKAIMR